MKLFFYPAIALMKRLGYTRKFALFWLMSLAAVVVVVYSLYASLNENIHASRRELEGIALATPISRVVQLIQEHRGLSASVLGGNRSMKERRAAREKEAAAVFDATEGKLPPNLASSEDWRSIKANWKRLREEGLKWTMEENFSAHTRLVDQLLIFKIVVSGEYVLPMDPQIDTSYLIDVAINRLPMALEHLGQIRAYSTDILGRKQATESQKVAIKTLIAEFNDEAKFIKIDFERVIRHNPALQSTLSAVTVGINDSAQHIADHVESDILTGHFATSPENFYNDASAVIDKGYAQMYGSLLPTIGTLINARIARAENVLRTSIGMAFLLFLAAAYFSLGIYYATIGSIRSLASSARTFAGGDMRERVDLGTHDELKEVGDSFNEMADGFSALLAAHREDEAKLCEINEHLEELVVQRTLKLAEAEERWSFALEGSGDGMWDWDLQTGRILFSGRYKEMLGFSGSENWSGIDDWKERVNPEDMTQAMMALEAHLDGKTENYTVEYRMLCKDGGWKWVLARGKVVSRAADGRPQRMIGTHTDITARKQVEQMLRTSEERFRSVFDHAGVGMHLAGPDYKYLKTNKAFCEMTGYAEEELLARDFRTITHPDDIEPNLTLSKKLLAGEIDSFHMEKRYVRKDGGILWGDLTVSAVRDGSGKLIYIIAVIQDITERKQSHEKLLTLSRAVENSPASVVITNLNGTIEYVNRKFTAVTGYSPDEALGQNPRILNAGIHTKEFYKKLWETIRSGNEWAGEIYNRKKNGAIYLEQVSISPILDDKGNIAHFVAVKEDITERKRIVEELQKAERDRAMFAVHQEDETRLRAIIETALDAVVQMDAEGIITGWNNQAEKIFGWTSEEAVGRALHETIIPPRYREAHVHGLKRLLASGEGPVLNSRVEMTGLHRDGHEFPVELSISQAKTTDKYEFNGFIRDITERKQAEAALLEKESQYRIAIETALDGFWMLDTRGCLLQVNDAYVRLSGYSRDELLNMCIPDLEVHERREEAAAHMEKIVQNGYDKFESRHKKKDGSIWPVQITSTYIPAEGGRFFVFISDLTARKQAEEKMLYLAHYDALTGLPNRTLLRDRLEQEIKKAHRASLKMALLFIDLDRFKEVNDTLGHSMGDILLMEAARRISDCVRETDTVARLGGDEFTVILSELDDTDSIDRIAGNILQKLVEPFQLEDKVAYVSASMGITLYPDDATLMEDLLKDADQAMYVAKNAGRNRYSYFTPALQEAAQTRLRLLNDLRGALAGGQFRIYFQPIVELATGRIHKAEALIRWQHPVRGMVSPAEFIPLAEESGLIVGIGDWIFKEAARHVKNWRALYNAEFQVSVNTSRHADFQISVNVSPVQLHITDLYQTWRAYMQELELPGKSMVIEITEGLLLDADTSVTDKLHEFHDVGIQVSLDDFGTGYSSLSYLKKFDIDYLKIDQSFVRDLATDPNDMALSEAIIVMAHKLGLKVIAEGVETEQQRDMLAAAGCDYGQGYLFSRPVPAKEFEKLLEHRGTKQSV